jgi:hypothetical protein
VASAAPPPHSNLHAPSCTNGESVANSPKAGRASVVPLSLVSGAIGRKPSLAFLASANNVDTPGGADSLLKALL